MRLKKGRLAIGLAAGTLAIATGIFRTKPGWSQAPAGGRDARASYRVLLGLRESAGRSWDGRLEAPGGRVFELTGWRFGPEDRVTGGTAWQCATRPRPFNPAIPERPDQTPLPVGLLVSFEGPRLEIHTANGNFGFSPSQMPETGAALFLDGQAAVERVPAVELHAAAEMEADYPSIAPAAGASATGTPVTGAPAAGASAAGAPATGSPAAGTSATGASATGSGFWMAWQSYRNESDAVWAQRFDGKAWGQPELLLEKGDVYRTAVAIAGNGETWVVWSQQVGGNWDLYGRARRGDTWTGVVRLTEAPGTDMMHRLIRDAKGNLWLVWQGARPRQAAKPAAEDVQFDILARRYDGRNWGPEQNLSRSAANDWEPAVAADARGNVWVAWDGYEMGNYDVYLSRLEGDGWSKPVPIAASANFEGHVSLAVDGAGRLWAAWDEGGRNWGKDTGFTIRGSGEPGAGLYAERRIKLACLVDGRWMQPRAMPEYAVKDPAYDFRDRPQLAADDTGRLWMAWRARYLVRFGQGMGGAQGVGGWETFAAAFDGARWSPPQWVPQSVARADTRVALAPAAGGGVWLAQATDQRSFAQNRPGRYAILTTRVTSRGRLQPLNLAPLQIDATEAPLAQAGERADIAKVQGYRAAGGKLRIVRGDMHRHTDISFGDGVGDGSLTDAYRYAIDAAGLDYLAVTDHTYGDNEYAWWRSQKSADLFRLGDRFIPLYAYERSLPYPNGHRNVVHARRGVRWLPIPDEERKGETGAARLYDYLKKTAGIAMSHTSATNMGTDWRDNDPVVEPLVEIFQGDRNNYEYSGAPRSAPPDRTDLEPGGYRPAGFVRNAWAKGYKLGVQASSDHLSTHLSYAMLLVENFTREGMLEAIRRRHAYGATDNIVLDVAMESPSGQRWMQGDSFQSEARPRLLAHIRGTADIERFEVIKNNNVVYSVDPHCQTCTLEFTDYEPDSAVSAVNFESFYYVRVRQFDGQLAWSSPMWVRRR